MTVASRVKTCLAEMKGIEATLRTFYEQARDEQAKRIYEEQAEAARRVAARLQARLDEITFEEPQYKGN